MDLPAEFQLRPRGRPAVLTDEQKTEHRRMYMQSYYLRNKERIDECSRRAMARRRKLKKAEQAAK